MTDILDALNAPNGVATLDSGGKVPAAQASRAVSIVQQVLDVPVSIIATTAEGYDYLNVFGLLSGVATAETNSAEFDLFAKGFI